MSSMNDRDALRRALQLADGIEPRADALQRIQARLRAPRPLVAAWAETTWTYLQMRVTDHLQRLLGWLRSVADLVRERLGPNSRASGHRAARGNGWLRPAAVLGATVFVVAVGTYVAIDAQQGLSPSAANALHNRGGGSGPGGGGGNASTNAHSPSAFPRSSSSPSASPTCTSPKSSASTPPTPATSPSSPSASPSATSISPSPSPTPAVSSSPVVSPATQSNLSATGAGVAATAHTVADLVEQTRTSASSTPSPCTTKRPSHRSTSGSTPNPSPLAVHFGKLDDGS